jgi:hypothetical protein
MINKFIKHNRINYPCWDIKYLDLYFSFSFFSFIFIYCWWFFFHIFAQWVLIYLIRCVHKFFDLLLGIFYAKKQVQRFCMFNCFFLIMFWCSRFYPYSYDFVFFFLDLFIKVLFSLISPFNLSLCCICLFFFFFVFILLILVLWFIFLFFSI